MPLQYSHTKFAGSWPRFFARFKRDRSGVTALEFALVGLPFLMFLFAIMEVGLVFFGSLQLEHAVEQTARLIRTGQAHEKGFDKAAFKSEVCGQIVGLFDCNAGLKINVKTYADFDSVEPIGDPLEDGELKEDFSFDIGAAENIVLVQVFYVWDVTVDFPGIGISNMKDRKRLLSASTTFRNEPFGG